MKNLSKPHLDAVYSIWKELVQPQDIVIDATCGNGHDTLRLAALSNHVIAIDLQKEALDHAKQLINGDSVQWFHQSHETFPENILPNTVKLIIYNLGYLPGGDKKIITQTDTTVKSIQSALPLLAPNGSITITCYNGHPGGAEEESALLAFVKSLDKHIYLVSYMQWINRNNHPSVIHIVKHPV